MADQIWFERKLLRERCQLDPDLRELLRDYDGAARTISLTEDQIRSLRDAVADQLQRAGFDENWAVNPEVWTRLSRRPA